MKSRLVSIQSFFFADVLCLSRGGKKYVSLPAAIVPSGVNHLACGRVRTRGIARAIAIVHARRDRKIARNQRSRVIDDGERSVSARPETRSSSLTSVAIGFHRDLVPTKSRASVDVLVLMRSCNLNPN